MNQLVEALIHRLRYAAVTPHLRPARRWADLGCHRTYPFLKKHRGLAKEAWGLDIGLTDGTDGALRLTHGDIMKPLPFADGSLDLITSLAVIEHVDDPKVVLREARRCLSGDGRLIVTTPSQRGIRLHELLVSTGLVKDVEPDEHRDFGMSAELLSSWAQEAGLAVEVCRTFELGLNVLLVARRAPLAGA
ncbi:MAG: methyltransferase domain-containing protein [Elusimicrobia bacterium]|nr:methyltransferase domain-containing protein [Elusimicrobiota bacterium]